MSIGSKVPVLLALALLAACHTSGAATTPEPTAPPAPMCTAPGAHTPPQDGIVEGQRVKGGPYVGLTQSSLRRLEAKGVRATHALVQFCVDAKGRVESVCFDRTTGDSEADATIEGAIRSWEFTPATKAGVAIGTCQLVTLRYRIS